MRSARSKRGGSITFFSKRLFGYFVLQQRIRQQLLQPRVLHFQRLQAFGVGDVRTTVLAPPEVVTRLREPVLAAQLLQRDALIRFPQKSDDLLFRKSLLHVQPPGRG